MLDLVPKGVVVARMWGDEFIVVGGISDSHQACMEDAMRMPKVCVSR